jgi:hypothetical protein
MSSTTTIVVVERIETDSASGRTHRDRQFFWSNASTPTILLAFFIDTDNF